MMTVLAGIINLTPDSFSDGGLYSETEAAVQQATQLILDGAALIDVGAESTRPGPTPLSAEAEWDRLEPALKLIMELYPGKVSVDTYHPETVRRAARFGPVIINDVTGMNNPEMIKVVTDLNLKCIVSHLPGPDIQLAHQLRPINSVAKVKSDLLKKRRFFNGGWLR